MIKIILFITILLDPIRAFSQVSEDSTRPLTLTISIGTAELSTRDELASPLIYTGYPLPIAGKIEYRTLPFTHTLYVNGYRSDWSLSSLSVPSVEYPIARSGDYFFVSAGYRLKKQWDSDDTNRSYALGATLSGFGMKRDYQYFGRAGFENYSWDGGGFIGPCFSITQHIPSLGNIVGEIDLPLFGYVVRPPYIGYFADFNTSYATQVVKEGSFRFIGSFVYLQTGITYFYPISTNLTANAAWQLRYYYLGGNDVSKWSDQSLSIGIGWRLSL